MLFRSLYGITGLKGDAGPQGNIGPMGPEGQQGVKGDMGERGLLGLKGKDGKDGKQGKEGVTQIISGGSTTPVRYTPITTATFTISERILLEGHNIFGVNYAGDVTITLPNNPLPTQIIVVKDESGSAGTNNITLTTDS